MKVKVKKVQYVDLQCLDSNSQLINKIYKSYFKHDIYNTDVKLQLESQGNVLIQYQDQSYHGSPVWVKKNQISDVELINLHFQLKKIYYRLLNMEKNSQ